MKINKGVYRKEMSQWQRGLPPVLNGQIQGRRLTLNLALNFEFTRGGRSHAVRNMPPYKCGVFVRRLPDLESYIDIEVSTFILNNGSISTLSILFFFP